ncbi:MAG: hypothetical protein JNM25_16655 [Planctomycetes bacterium]|nr:hypothetical protein [Planctomycetota bacterium]
MSLVVFVRGINVGGHRTFRPAAFAARWRDLDAVNIGAAGTFVIRHPVGAAWLRAEIRRRLPFVAEVMVCPGREIRRLVARDFFGGRPARRDLVRFVSVLARRPRSAPRLPMALPSRGRWVLQVLAREGRYVVGHHRRRMQAIGWLGRLDTLFGAPATTRSWNTMTAIAAALGNGAA